MGFICAEPVYLGLIAVGVRFESALSDLDHTKLAGVNAGETLGFVKNRF